MEAKVNSINTQVLPAGKYKGSKIMLMDGLEQLNYLRWLYSSEQYKRLTEAQRLAVKFRLGY